MEQLPPWQPERHNGLGDIANPKSRADSLHESARAVDTTATLTANSSGPCPIAITILSIPGKDVLRFLMPHNPQHARHYRAALSAIQARLEAAVIAVTPDEQTPWNRLVFQPMMVGKNEQDAKLHVAVLCEPSLAPILEHAFTHEPIQSELGIPNSDETLGYIVIPEPHEDVNAQLPIDVFSQTHYEAKYNTYCGAPLLVKHENAIRQATFGGVIKVSFANGDSRFYGMTAGHVMRADQQHRHQLSKVSIADTNSMQDPFGVSNWLSSEDSLGSPLDPEQLPGVKAQRTRFSHDWCIFETKNPRGNRALQRRRDGSPEGICAKKEDNGHPILIAESPTFNDDFSDPVLVLGAAAGTRQGTLSVLPASLWMASCRSFVSVYVLHMNSDQKVIKGDSGAWVVHAAGPALYGHVVATNMFGEVYVVPINDAFENIKACLGATSVTLPIETETEQAPVPEAEQHFVGQSSPCKTHNTLHMVKEWDRRFFQDRPRHVKPFSGALDAPFVRCLPLTTKIPQKQGFPRYQLEFNLPCFTVRRPSCLGSEKDRNISSGTQNLHQSRKVIDLNISVHESCTSVVISGYDHASWHGYAFGSLNDAEHSGDFEEDNMYHVDEEDDTYHVDEENGCWIGDPAYQSDFFATAGGEAFFHTIFTKDAMWDPRMYFLCALQLRLQDVVKKQEYLVHKLRASYETWMTETSGKKSLRQNLETLLSTDKLFRHIRNRYRTATQTWDRFSSADGDLSYFSDLSHPNVSILLNDIEEAYDSLRHLAFALEDMISESGAGINAFNQTELTLQMIGTLVIAVIYFSAERSIFAFERNMQTFFIGTVILMASLIALTLLLRAVDRFRDAVGSRLLGAITPVIEIPTCESSDWMHSTRASESGPRIAHESHGRLV
ncbi:hypothetical protein SVAN01_03610 [Stagonosporopsis vannaccii]|nr:hypothetical protein SVAN01_03610 [Stagonosporopsis vannaccii]